MTISITADRNIYFSGFYNGKYGIHKAVFKDGSSSEPVRLPDEVNYLRSAHPFIAPDESFLLMDAQPEGPGKSEIFISFKNSDGSWTKAVRIGEAVNKTRTEFNASVSPNGKFLFFHRKINGNGDIFWVSTEILNNLREK